MIIYFKNYLTDLKCYNSLSDGIKSKNKMVDRDMRRNMARSPLMYGLKIDKDIDEDGKTFF